MAITYTEVWNTFTQEQFDDVFSHSTGILSTIHAEWGVATGSLAGWNFYIGEGTDNQIGYFAIGNRLNTGVIPDSSLYAVGAYVYAVTGYMKIVSTGSAVAVVNVDASGNSYYGFIFALDNSGNLVMIASNQANMIRTNPYIVSRSKFYLQSGVTYGGNTSESFGQIALENIPSPQYDEPPKEIKDVYFASTNTSLTDREIEYGGDKFYCIAGGIVMKDYLN